MFHFSASPPTGRPLRVGFRAAAARPVGARLLDELDGQKGRPREFWHWIHCLADNTNGLEQQFLLHAVARGRLDLEEFHPHRTRLNLPVVQQPGRPWLALVHPLDDGYIVLYPQLEIGTRPGCTRRLDVLAVIVGQGARPCTWT